MPEREKIRSSLENAAGFLWHVSRLGSIKCAAGRMAWGALAALGFYRRGAALAEEVGVHSDELVHVLEFLHNAGHLVYFNEPSLRDIVVLDPQWLAEAMAHVRAASAGGDRSPRARASPGSVSGARCE